MILSAKFSFHCWICKSWVYIFIPSKYAENNPVANCSNYCQKLRTFSCGITWCWFGSLKVCMFVGTLESTRLFWIYFIFFRKSWLQASLPPQTEAYSISLPYQHYHHNPSEGLGAKNAALKSRTFWTPLRLQLKRKFSTLRKKALLGSSKNKPAVVLYFCVKITKWKQEMLAYCLGPAKVTFN